jgi:hypothetical protein
VNALLARALIVTDVPGPTPGVFTVNAALVDPAGIWMRDGTAATLVSLLSNTTATPANTLLSVPSFTPSPRA